MNSNKVRRKPNLINMKLVHIIKENDLFFLKAVCFSAKSYEDWSHICFSYVSLMYDAIVTALVSTGQFNDRPSKLWHSVQFSCLQQYSGTESNLLNFPGGVVTMMRILPLGAKSYWINQKLYLNRKMIKNYRIPKSDFFFV